MADPNRYRIVRRIAQGGAAELLEARIAGARGAERKVAIKRLLPENAQDLAFVRAFVDEASLAGRLVHPNIVPVLDSGVMDGLPFLVMELVEGLDADELAVLAGGVLPVEIALYLAARVARGLAFAHDARGDDRAPLGIVHRDVHPKNVLVSYDGEVKLTDFGIALAARRLERTAVGIVKGTLAYMAPEQQLGRDVDARADLFAVGCTLHRLVAGHSPLESDEARRTFVAGGPLPLSPLLPEDVQAIVRRATRFEARERHADAAELARELEQAFVLRVPGDAADHFRAWIQPFAPRARARPARGVAALFDIQLIDPDAVAGPIRRFETVRPAPEHAAASSGSPALEPSDQPEAALGTVIRGYRLEALLGEGGLARVYRAKHELLDRRCAIKILRPSRAGTTAARRMIREAQLASRVSHPHLVTVFDCGLTPQGLPFLSMELLDGPSLRTVIRSGGPLSPWRAARFLRQIVSGLAEAHRHGLVHRDLKPANIVVTGPPGGEILKIVDFGIARVVEPEDGQTQLTKAAALLGSPKFMAPEQIEAPSSAGPQADFYALGATLAVMIGGSAPFSGTVDQILEAHLLRAPPPLPEAGGLGPLATRLLAKLPDARPTAAQVLAELDRLGLDLGAEPAQEETATEAVTRTAPLATVPARALGPRERRAPGVAPLVLLGIALVIAAATTTWAVRQPERRSPPAVVPELAPPPVPRAVAAAPEPVAEPPLPAQVEPVPSVSRPAPRPRPRPELETLEAELAAALKVRNITREELASAENFPDVAKYFAAVAARDAAAARTHLQEVLGSLDDVAAAPALLQARLRRAAAALEKWAQNADRGSVAEMERRYFALRARFTPRLDAAGRRALAGEVARFEQELKAR